MAKHTVVTLGDLVADQVVAISHFPIRAQEHQPAHDMYIEAGGTGNLLIIAARLGLDVIPLGSVGQDHNGQLILGMLSEEGVDVSKVVAPAGNRTTTSLVLVDDQAQHVFIGMHKSGQPVLFDPAWRTIIEQAGALFTTGYAMNPKLTFTLETVTTCLDIANQCGVPVFFDLGPAAFHASRHDVEAAVGQATVLLATLEEAASWTGIDDPLRAAETFLTQKPSLVIIKLGEQGCLFVTEEQHIQIDAFPVDVRDTAGAGDSFAGACIFGHLHGFTLEQTGLLANAVGALAVSRLGTGTRLPQKQEIIQLLQRNGYQILN